MKIDDWIPAFAGMTGVGRNATLDEEGVYHLIILLVTSGRFW